MTTEINFPTPRRRRHALEIRRRREGLLVVFVVLISSISSSACNPTPEAAASVSFVALDSSVAMSFVGGTGGDAIRDVAVDGEGNVYLAGGSTSADFPVTANAFGRTFLSQGREQDAFVVKISPTGSVLWSTLLSSPNYDRVYGIEVDDAGYIYVAGRAGAAFPVTPGAFQTDFKSSIDHVLYGQQDGFVCKLKPDGTAIVFCSYFGDRSIPPIRDIAIDANGDIYVVSSTQFGELPQEWFANAFQKSVRGQTDLVVAKIKNDGSRVLWATYLGGSGIEYNTTSIRVDKTGNSYVMTTTTSSDAPVPGGFDKQLDGTSDIYVAKISADGSRLLWGTYYGGSGADNSETHSIAIDEQEQVYIAAMTQSVDLPLTPGALQTTFGGKSTMRRTGAGTNYAGDAFVAKISADGGTLLASTYYGGSAGDGIEGLSVDRQGNIYVTGGTYSKDLKLTAKLPVGPGGETDIFVAKLSNDLTRVLYAAQFGGEGPDVARSSAIDAAGNLYVVGESESPLLGAKRPATTRRRGAPDGVWAKITFR